MQPMAICPECRMLLIADAAAPNRLTCRGCRGLFLRAASSLEATPDLLVKPAVDGQQPLSCPDCLGPMERFESSSVSQIQHQCAACGGLWLEPPVTSEPTALDTEPVAAREGVAADEGHATSEKPSFVKSLLYGVSLPERVLRSAVGVTAGTVRDTAEFLIPQAFRSSKSYEVAIHNSLTFLTETVGGFNREGAAVDDAGEHLAKKAIGNFVDMAGLATLHVSPMWVLAAVSDVAYGSSAYLQELAAELEKQGVIDKSSTIHNVDDILEAIQNTSGGVASSIDKPPISVAELRAFVMETRAAAAKADFRRILPEREVRQYWESLSAAALKENISPFEAATAVAMHTAQQASNISMSAVTGVKVAGSLLQRNVFQHYQDSLLKLQRDGFLNLLQSTFRPYVGHVWNNFAAERKSWTETLLDPDQVFRFFQKSSKP